MKLSREKRKRLRERLGRAYVRSTERLVKALRRRGVDFKLSGNVLIVMIDSPGGAIGDPTV